MKRELFQKRAGYAVGGALVLAMAIPVVAQHSPTSLLPPGFGDQSDDAPSSQPESAQPASTPRPQAQRPALQLDLGDAGAAPPILQPSNSTLPVDEELTPEELAAQQAKYDLPDTARRSLTRIGPLTGETGGFAPGAFGTMRGRYLAALMHSARAPFVSRWGSILLRRALLSATDTPSDINGADWAAERAWLLVRMGEADAARMLVQSVDADKYTRFLASVAMQSYLSAADPAGLCSITEYPAVLDSTPSWMMAKAFCASFSGDQGTASAILNQEQRHEKMKPIDYRLSEKIVGAGVNARRSVKIEWDGVDQLTAWRFGLATAANVDIPAPLMDKAGMRVRAWQARAPMLSLAARLPGVEDAAVLGVFSSNALVDFYAQLSASDDQPEGFGQRADALQNAYTAGQVGARIEAMRTLWSGQGTSAYVGMLAVARAAAALPVTDASGLDVSNLIAAMMSAGYDGSAARWAQAREQIDSSDGALGWALLAVGSPRIVVDVSADKVADYTGGNGTRGQMLLAGIAGLARLSPTEASRIASENGLSLAPASRWAREIDAAARRGEKGSVSLLAAIGMQTGAWNRMPPAHLYHIVSALHRVGLDPEARMIAAEALTRV